MPVRISVRLAMLLVLAIFPVGCGDSRQARQHGDEPQKANATMTEGQTTNRLIHEKSPYLLQHAYNPVDWYPWGEEAFARARAQDKPIFLSVGYSTCHWCHVMERESFESDSIAEIMNEYFVCIKVDREERPDVDKVYMTSLQSMGIGGGWPMSMFLTPELKPFYGGTYFPPQTQHGRIGFGELLRRIHHIWTNERTKVLESADGLTKFLTETSSQAPSGELPAASLLDTCFDHFAKTFDSAFGGFGGAPKFPRPSVFNFLMKYHARTGNTQALEMTLHTLRRMASGGVYDHLGGGFHRYSVDGEWRVPHFEKMLYDQAQLVVAYVDAYLLTHDPFFEEVARGTMEYVLRDLTGAQGGFLSAEDADSQRSAEEHEKSEGAFYVWTKKEILDVLGKREAEVFVFHYGVEEDGNALVDPQNEFTGRNILYVAHSLDETARRFGMSVEQVSEMLQKSRALLFDFREKRPRPHRDDKVITAWNGLMMSACARAYQAFDDPRYLAAAQRAAEFVRSKLVDGKSGKVYRRYRDGEVKFEGQLDDYAFLVQGLLDLYESSFETVWLQTAVDLTTAQVSRFYDEKSGLFFDTPGGDPSILVRMKEMYDGAEPTGNAIAVMNLLRLSEIAEKQEWRGVAEKALGSANTILARQPSAMPQMFCALDFVLSTPLQIVLAGSRDAAPTRTLLKEIRLRYIPHRVVLLIDPDERGALRTLAPFASTLTPVGNSPAVYVCENYACKLPTGDPAQLAGILDGMKKQRSHP